MRHPRSESSDDHVKGATAPGHATNVVRPRGPSVRGCFGSPVASVKPVV